MGSLYGNPNSIKSTSASRSPFKTAAVVALEGSPAVINGMNAILPQFAAFLNESDIFDMMITELKYSKATTDKAAE